MFYTITNKSINSMRMDTNVQPITGVYGCCQHLYMR